VCVVSPNGQWIATSGPSAIGIRSTRTLRLAAPVKLPPDLLSAPVTTLAWSPSSTKLLAMVAEDLCVLPADGSDGSAPIFTIKNPVSGSGKPSYAQFGRDDNELIVFATLGLKVLVFNLVTRKAVEIGSPKWYLPASAPRAYSLHPHTGHLVLLTRVGGRDILSIYDPITRQLHRSWFPETSDAQSVAWSPDGQWLLLWDAAIYGRHLLLYTPDGQLFRRLERPVGEDNEISHLSLGIRFCKFSLDGQMCAVCDYGDSITILNTGTWRRHLTLDHPPTIIPSQTVHVWQEQLQGTRPAFVRATQTISPPAPAADGRLQRDATSGCSLAQFDASSNLLATRLDESPTTLWIWDLAAAELRAVLIFHSTVEFQWHPSIQELLLITCPDETRRSSAFVWDPLSDGPAFAAFEEQLPEQRLASKERALWVNSSSEPPTLLLSDNRHYCLLSLASEGQAPHWQDVTEQTIDNTSGDASLLQAGFVRTQNATRSPNNHDADVDDDDTSLVDETFFFKRVR
jgi:hypothetical protein